MANNIYSKNSIINIGKDNFTINSGNVTRENNSIKMSANSRCTFNYDYIKPLQTNKLKVVCGFNANNIHTRYSNSVQAIIQVQFYKSEYEDGKYKYYDDSVQTINIIPYENTETKGNYKFDEIDLKENYIKSIKIILYYINTDDEEAEIIIDKLQVYNVENIDEQSVIDSVQEAFENGSMDLVIPLVQTLPDINNVPDGYICRVASVIVSG